MAVVAAVHKATAVGIIPVLGDCSPRRIAEVRSVLQRDVGNLEVVVAVMAELDEIAGIVGDEDVSASRSLATQVATTAKWQALVRAWGRGHRRWCVLTL
jgi:hypothetical protein